MFSLVLVKLPELRDRLRLTRNRSLWSRVHCRIRIDDPSDADTVEYVGYRLRHAGTERNVFSSDALSMLHEGTVGRLREIDRVATLALKSAARRKLKTVDRDIISHLLEPDC